MEKRTSCSVQTSTNCDNSLETLNSAHQATGAVQMRIKNANSHPDRQSQTKSMILTDAGKVTEPISRHRRNHSQHVLKDVIPPLEHPMVEKEGYLQKAKIADGGKKLRKRARFFPKTVSCKQHSNQPPSRGKTGLLPGLFSLAENLNFTKTPSSKLSLT
ncbi:rCG37760, isoform CRA_b [Rattus norvegicus]|uniref:RCG37760, isoform CRA_b n=1 Tax=Rattus norvegicus TaxID=10116 RepID=A6JEX5_RAT|nr:rCG37760, isoform CRA_b [Rattus norvegicus]